MTQTTTIAVMQPYFMPYAGYFRLMAGADVFVIYDCVQFPKGGWVHRNRLPDTNGDLRWLTLPIQRPSLGTQIVSLAFLPDAERVMRERLLPFPEIFAHMQNDPLLMPLLKFEARPIDYLVAQLEAVSTHLGLPARFVRASSLQPTPHKTAPERVIELVQKLGGGVYINASGGRDLYDSEMFADSGIELRFLSPYPGSNISILHRLIREDAEDLRAEILAATRLEA